MRIIPPHPWGLRPIRCFISEITCVGLNVVLIVRTLAVMVVSVGKHHHNLGLNVIRKSVLDHKRFIKDVFGLKFD